MALTPHQISTAVRYYRSDETRDLTSVAEAIGVQRADLAAACRADPRLADALDFQPDVDPTEAVTEAEAAPERDESHEAAPAHRPDDPNPFGPGKGA